jgi:hypothetical protein
MDIVEVVARIGDSTIDLVHLAPGGTYTVPLGAIARFPLVEGNLVRIPVGYSAKTAGRRVSGSALRLRDDTIEVELGITTIAIRKLTRPHMPVARPRFDIRMAIYMFASLIVLLAICLAAITLAPVHDAPARRRPVRLVHPQPPPPPPAPTPPPPPPQTTRTAQQPPRATTAEHPRDPGRHAVRAGAAAESPTEDGYAAIARFAQNVKTPVIELDGTGAGPDDYTSNDYGHTRRFDPTANPEYDSVKVTKWAVASAGKGLGQTLPPPKMQWCDDDSCAAHGPIAMAAFVRELERHREQISNCYVDHTDSVEGPVRIRFSVTTDGKAYARDVRFTGTSGGKGMSEVRGDAPIGAGIGTVGRCVGKILAGVQWPHASAETDVWIGIAFSPPGAG